MIWSRRPLGVFFQFFFGDGGVRIIPLNWNQLDVLWLDYRIRFRRRPQRRPIRSYWHIRALTSFHHLVRPFISRRLIGFSLFLDDRLNSFQTLLPLFLFDFLFLRFLLDFAVSIKRSLNESQRWSFGEIGLHVPIVPLNRPLFFNHGFDIRSSWSSYRPIQRGGDVEHGAFIVELRLGPINPFLLVELFLLIRDLSFSLSLNIFLHHLQILPLLRPMSNNRLDTSMKLWIKPLGQLRSAWIVRSKPFSEHHHRIPKSGIAAFLNAAVHFFFILRKINPKPSLGWLRLKPFPFNFKLRLGSFLFVLVCPVFSELLGHYIIDDPVDPLLLRMYNS